LRIATETFRMFPDVSVVVVTYATPLGVDVLASCAM
jgi:hypothetical protein